MNKELKYKELAKAMDKYIVFLTKEIDRVALFLIDHNVNCSTDIFIEGVELRSKILSLKKELKINKKTDIIYLR